MSSTISKDFIPNLLPRDLRSLKFDYCFRVDEKGYLVKLGNEEFEHKDSGVDFEKVNLRKILASRILIQDHDRMLVNRWMAQIDGEIFYLARINDKKIVDEAGKNLVIVQQGYEDQDDNEKISILVLDFKYFGFSGNTVIDFLANHIENSDSSLFRFEQEEVKPVAQLPDNPVKVFKPSKEKDDDKVPPSTSFEATVVVAQPIFESDAEGPGISN